MARYEPDRIAHGRATPEATTDRPLPPGTHTGGRCVFDDSGQHVRGKAHNGSQGTWRRADGDRLFGPHLRAGMSPARSLDVEACGWGAVFLPPIRGPERRGGGARFEGQSPRRELRTGDPPRDQSLRAFLSLQRAGVVYRVLRLAARLCRAFASVASVCRLSDGLLMGGLWIVLGLFTGSVRVMCGMCTGCL